MKMMKKMIGFALLAVVVFSAISASSAFAENPLWLVDGVDASGQKVESVGLFTFTDLKAPIIGEGAIDCEISFDGTINANGAGSITEILNSAKEAISTTPLSGLFLTCTDVKNCEKPEVYLAGLPWTVQLELTTDVVEKIGSASGEIGFELNCTALGVKIEDKCLKAASLSVIENMLEGEANDLLEIFNEERALCSFSKEETGDIVGERLISEVLGLILTVSGDGVTE